MNKIRKGDEVVVISGKNKGKKGSINKYIPSKNMVSISGVNIYKKHKKATENDPGGIKNIEKPIHISNVAYLDKVKNKPTKIGFKMENGKKVRFAKLSGEIIN